MSRINWVLSCVFVVACSGDDDVADAGEDGRVADVGMLDAGTDAAQDAGADAGEIDAASDVGSDDGGTSDLCTFTNVPDGFGLADRNDFTELTPEGWNIRTNQSDRPPELVETASPCGGSVARQWWSGVDDTWSPDYLGVELPSPTQVFFGVVYRVSPEWDAGEGPGWTKWFTVINGEGNAWWGSAPPGAPGERTMTERFQFAPPGFSHQFAAGTRDTSAFATEPIITHGEWVKLELFLDLREGNYAVRAWVNGTLVTDGVPEFDVIPSPLQELKLGSTLGGGSGLTTLDERYWAEYDVVATYVP